jgi:hypothetical protein
VFGPLNVAIDNITVNVFDCGGAKRPFTGQELKQQHTHTPPISGKVMPCGEQHFWRQIVVSAHTTKAKVGRAAEQHRLRRRVTRRTATRLILTAAAATAATAAAGRVVAAHSSQLCAQCAVFRGFVVG